MANSPEEWYNALPKLTRFYLTACFLTTCLCTLGFINPYQLHLEFELIWKKFQIWRLATCFIFLGEFSFPFLIKLMILVQYSARLEADPFPAGGNPTADYALMFCFGALILWPIGYFMGLPFLGSSMVFMIVYVWSRRQPDAPVSIWGFKLQALYLPWALMAFTILIGGSPMMDIIGVVAGHLFYFLLEVLPETHGASVLKTPQFLINWFPMEGAVFRTINGTGPRRPHSAPSNTPSGHSWGSGRPLGGN